MTKFLDTTNEDEWEIKLTGGDLKALKRELDIDLRIILTPQDGKFAEMLQHEEKQLDLAWFFCAKQARERFPRVEEQIKNDDTGEMETHILKPRPQFEKLFDRDTGKNFVLAVWEEVWSFFRGPKAGAEMRLLLIDATEGVSELTATAIQKLHNKFLNSQTSSDSVNNSQELQASTTAVSH